MVLSCLVIPARVLSSHVTATPVDREGPFPPQRPGAMSWEGPQWATPYRVSRRPCGTGAEARQPDPKPLGRGGASPTPTCVFRKADGQR